MKLVLYSGGDKDENNSLDREVIELSSNKDPLFVFIPADMYDGESEFQEIVDRFAPMGVKRFLYFPVDVPFDKVLLKEVLKSDIIYLGGGNTYYFIQHLRSTGFFNQLKSFSKRGGVIAGVSAGAIMMTPNIETAGYPSFDCDDNEDNVVNLKAMNLVQFEFFPHYRNSDRYDKVLKKKSKTKDYPLYALPDGSGIIKNYEKLSFLGKAWCFYKGQKINLTGKKALSK